ncbi:MAG: substrate-binding domain-containing protein [Hyphomonadaceae bacterium]
MLRYVAFALGFLLTACGNSGTNLSDLDGIEVTPPPSVGDVTAIKIVGSSTVAPFATTVAEQFGAASEFPTPIVETTGTGGGFKAFCQGIGPDQPSVSNASRPIKPSEITLCSDAGVTEIVEVQIGFDGIVMANAKDGPVFDLTLEEIYRALAADLPDGNGGWMENPNETWSDVAPHLPDVPILVSGPPPTSGTRDAFVEIAMERGAKFLPQLAALKVSDKPQFKLRAHTIRTDGAWIDSGENDTAIVQTLIKNPTSVGVFGYSFLEQNLDRVKGANVDGVTPTFENIAAGDYAISRSLFFYVKRQNAGLVPGLEAYIEAFTQDDAWGPDGYLAEKGLIPLPVETRAAVRAASMAMDVME